MKKYIFLLVFSTSVLFTFSQNKAIYTNSKNSFFGIGVSLGIFNPNDVNDYLRNYWDNEIAGYNVDKYGYPEMYFNFVLQICGGTFVSQQMELKGIFEFGIGPKIIIIHDTKFFGFFRYSPGVICNYHIPSSKSNNFLIGGGILYHNMKFKEWKASAFGPRLKAGYNIYFKKKIIELFLAFDIVNGKTNSIGIENLNYSGLLLGCNFKF